MKQTLVFLLMAAGIAAVVPAQNRGHMGREPRVNVKTETVTVKGNLVIAQGAIAVKDGGATYIVERLARFVGFIDGLKEGAQVTLEGVAITSRYDSSVKLLRPAKMTLNGRDYDLSSPAGADWQGRKVYPNGPMPPAAPYGQDRNRRNPPNAQKGRGRF